MACSAPPLIVFLYIGNRFPLITSFHSRCFLSVGRLTVLSLGFPVYGYAHLAVSRWLLAPGAGFWLLTSILLIRP